MYEKKEPQILNKITKVFCFRVIKSEGLYYKTVTH